MGRCRRSYILLVRKFRTSEMLDKWSPTSKLSDIKLFHYPDWRYIFHLSDIKLFHYPDCRYFFTCTISNCSTIQTVDIFFTCTISNCSTIQTVDIFFTCTRARLSAILFFTYFLISSNFFPCLLWLNFEYWLCIVFTTFWRTGILPDFTWIFIDWVSAGFLTDAFSPWPKKKRHR